MLKITKMMAAVLVLATLTGAALGAKPAGRFGLTLVGFLRGKRLNVYTGFDLFPGGGLLSASLVLERIVVFHSCRIPSIHIDWRPDIFASLLGGYWFLIVANPTDFVAVKIQPHSNPPPIVIRQLKVFMLFGGCEYLHES